MRTPTFDRCMVNPSLNDARQHVYLCGFSSEIEYRFSNYFSSLSTRYVVRVSTLDAVFSAVHSYTPTFLFLSAQDKQTLSEITENMAFVRCNLPSVYRIVVCRQRMLTEHNLDEVSWDGLLTSECSSQDLLECLMKTSEGKRYIQYPVFRNSGNSFIPDTLTRHERVILGLITKGFQNKQIAEQLSISPHTVKNHKSKLMTKLDLNSTIDLYQFGADQDKGLSKVDDE